MKDVLHDLRFLCNEVVSGRAHGLSFVLRRPNYFL